MYVRVHLAESVFGGEMRETTNKESAIRVADNFWVAKRIICKIGERNYIQRGTLIIINNLNRRSRSSYIGRHWSKGELCERRDRGVECQFRRCFRLGLDGTSPHKTLNLYCCRHLGSFLRRRSSKSVADNSSAKLKGVLLQRKIEKIAKLQLQSHISL